MPKHTHEQAGGTKAAALDLLRRNSREAAAAVRAFTNDELDRAAPLSLSYGAPVPAQFVIEDQCIAAQPAAPGAHPHGLGPVTFAAGGA